MIWRCNRKYDSGQKCCTPHVSETQIIEKFMVAFNQIFTKREELFSTFDLIKDTLFCTDMLTAKQAELENEILIVTKMLEDLIHENMSRVQDQVEYSRKRQALVDRHDKAKVKLDKVNAELIEMLAKRAAIERFLDTLRCADAPITEFSENIWLNTVKSVTVIDKDTMVFVFKDGTEVRV